MIALPDSPAPNGMDWALLDRGYIQRGASSLRVDQKGSRHRVALSYPPMVPDVARKFVQRLKRAKSEGVRAKLPMIVPQGIPGAPVVDGAGQQGLSLAVRGLTPGYLAKEGYWLCITAADGSSCLYSVQEPVVAGSDGKATIELDVALRVPYADGARIEMARPWVEGFIDGETFDWFVSVDRLTTIQFTVEEYK